jgi:prepilin-type processing-associated H-X9-DG protein
MPLTLKSITDPDKTLLIADYTLTKDAMRNCILQDSQLSKRHDNKTNISYVDGHVSLGATYQLRFPIKYNVPH